MKTIKNVLIYLILTIIWLSNSAFMGDIYMKNFVDSFNEDCPASFSSNARIDSLEALPNKIIKFNVTITQEMNESQVNILSKIFKETFHLQQMAIITSEPFQALREMGVKFLFVYYLKDGSEINRQLIQPEEYNSFDRNTLSKNTDKTLQYAVEAIKSQLPIEDPITGLTIIDCYQADSTLNYVATLPNEYIDEVIEVIGKDIFSALQTNSLKKMQSVINLVSKGYLCKYIYLKENKEPYMENLISADILKGKISSEKTDYLLARATAYNTAYSTRRSLRQMPEEYFDDAIVVLDSHVRGDTLIMSMRISEELLEDTDASSFALVAYPAMREELKSDAETLSMVSNGIFLKYEYKKANGEPFQNLTFSPNDFLEIQAEKNKESAEEKVKALIAQVNKRLPFKGPSGLEMKECYLDDKNIVLLIIYDNLTEKDREEFNKNMPQLVKQISATQVNMKEILEDGYFLKVLINDSNGNNLLNYSFSDDDL